MHVLIRKLQIAHVLVVPLGTSNCVRRSQAAALGEDHEATLRTRMGLVNVLAETGRGEMAEDICRGVEEVCFAGTSGLFFLHPFSRAWISVGADEAARGGAPRHAAVAAQPRMSAGGQRRRGGGGASLPGGGAPPQALSLPPCGC